MKSGFPLAMLAGYDWLIQTGALPGDWSISQPVVVVVEGVGR